MWRIIDIGSDDVILRSDKNNLLIQQEDKKTIVHLSDVSCVLVHNNSTLISKNAINILADNKVPCVFCDEKHMPKSILLPISAHYHQTERCIAQANLKEAAKKKIWKAIVKAKIKGQAEVLHTDIDKKYLTNLISTVKSGDTTNRESVSARYYWQKVFGDNFRRNPDQSGLNAHLNYGYAILRAVVARYLVSVGLNPALGVFHCNKLNNFCLADDVMEPFRPIVDKIVYDNHTQWVGALIPEAKRQLAEIVIHPVIINGDIYPLHKAIEKCCSSLSFYMCGQTENLVLPDTLFVK